MGIPILSVRDDQGNIIPIPAIQGRDGVDGKDGKDGAAGPNLINADTLTPMAGILMGAGGSVKTAVSGTDYATPAEVAAKVDADDYTRTINTATTTGAAGKYLMPVGVNSARPFAAGVHIVFYDGTNWRMLDNAFLPIIGGTV